MSCSAEVEMNVCAGQLFLRLFQGELRIRDGKGMEWCDVVVRAQVEN